MKKIALGRCFLRSFLFQALWNFERMQNVGFAFCMDPLLRVVYKSKHDFHEALRRHMEYFNTHPYFAPVVMGVLMNREQAAVDNKRSVDPTLTVLKNSMGGAFGAIGDHVIWGSWRPFSAIMALSVGLLVGYPTGQGASLPVYNPASALQCSRWWVVGFLSMFNSIHFWLRWRGLVKAAQDGPLVVKWVESLHLQRWAAQIRRIGLLFLFVMVLVYFSRWTSSEMLIWLVAVFLGSAILKRWRAATWVLFYGVFLVAMVMTRLGIHWPS